jgi:uncharacterized protein (TIGR02145 family)
VDACDCAGNELDEQGNCADYLADTDGDGVYDEVLDPCLGQTHLSYHGKSYALVAIDGNCWFKENLATTLTRDTTAIPEETDYTTWNNLATPAFARYGNSDDGVETHGLLYNAYATTAEYGLCPTNWVIPSSADWQALADALGDASTAGGAMKESGTSHWLAPNTGATNSSGFTALPSGQRQVGTLGDIHIGEEAWFWTPKTLSNPTLLTSWGLSHTSATLSSAQHSLKRGHSVRCLLIPILGCTDLNFMEYNAAANVDDGSCQTPAFPGCTDERYSEFDPTANLDDGSCTHLAGCTPTDVVAFDGYNYTLVTIGEQCWFKENLRSEHYNDGSAIPEVQDNAEWGALSTGAQSYWGNNTTNLATYGRLYNWYAVDDSRGLCPSGWHVPSDGEWTVLTDYLGGLSFAGGQMKSSATDSPTWDGTNTSGFSGLPGGNRSNYGIFDSFGFRGYWWSSSPYFTSAWLRNLTSGSDVVEQSSYYYGQWFGLSVRCIRD